MSEDLTCMISLELFVFPITMPCCGVSFSKKHILEWTKQQNNCPNCKCKNNLNIADLRKNVALDNVVENYIKNNTLTEEQKIIRELEKKFMLDFELNLMKEKVIESMLPYNMTIKNSDISENNSLIGKNSKISNCTISNNTIIGKNFNDNSISRNNIIELPSLIGKNSKISNCTISGNTMIGMEL